tara:strand:- start:130 stop:816 length:687 start_codon:yes stop_codon:yes gene_type:complete
MRNYNDLDWGWMNEDADLAKYHKNSIINEIFKSKIYEEIYQVKEGDVVVDIGASIGPFTYSILDTNPKMVYVLEPSTSEFETLTKNLGDNSNVTLINKGITYSDSVVKSNMMFGGEDEFNGTKFSSFIRDNNIDYIDFIKTDCEGGEYHVFMEENMDYLLNNVGCIVGEWHLNTKAEKIEFRYFRDKYLLQFKQFEVRSLDGVDIKWDLRNDHFIEYYNQVMIHISNK